MYSHATEQFSARQASPLSDEVMLNPRDGAEETSNLVSSYYRVSRHESTDLGVHPTRFQSHFTGCMTLHADASTVSHYLDGHHSWFRRCAHPMKVEPLGENGYALAVGRFGAFGYDVEPSIGLDLLPQDQGVYRIKTLPIPNQVALGYEVDFQAALQLVEAPVAAQADRGEITHVEWSLDLAVNIQFPKFIQRLPGPLVQKTGDRLLMQIIRQVSHRLTVKVQDDFHQSLGIAVPKASRKRS